MAKKTDEKEVEKKKSASLNDVFAAVDALNADASLLSDDNSLSIVNDWIDTGSYALNVICSGSQYKGIPVGRVSGFSGPPQCGKSLILNKIMANAQKKGYHAVVWDTESAIDRNFAEAVGMDAKRTKYYPIETVEDCRNQISRFLDNVIEANDPKLKVIIALDSLGNLSSAKEVKDAEKDKSAVDMGARAKAIRSMSRAFTYKAAKAKVPIIFSNHTYQDPMAMFDQLVKQTSGGQGPSYIASLLVQLSVLNEKIEKNEDEESVAIAHMVSGVTISAMTTKNRFAPPYLKTKLYNNFRTGLSKYTGLYEIALAFGAITEDGHSYCFNGEKIRKSREWMEDAPTLWEQKIMPALEEILKVKVCYSNNAFPLVNEADVKV